MLGHSSKYYTRLDTNGRKEREGRGGILTHEKGDLIGIAEIWYMDSCSCNLEFKRVF